MNCAKSRFFVEKLFLKVDFRKSLILETTLLPRSLSQFRYDFKVFSAFKVFKVLSVVAGVLLIFYFVVNHFVGVPWCGLASQVFVEPVEVCVVIQGHGREI